MLQKLDDVESLYGIRKDALTSSTSQALGELDKTFAQSGFAMSGSADKAREALFKNYENIYLEEHTKHQQDVRGIKEDIIGGYYTQMGQLV